MRRWYFHFGLYLVLIGLAVLALCPAFGGVSGSESLAGCGLTAAAFVHLAIGLHFKTLYILADRREAKAGS